MALSDYTPTLAWFADSLADLDIPTGTTKSNPGGLSDPTLAGTPDSYADFDGTDGINFLPATPVMETNLGDMTLVIKARIDTLTANDVLFSNYDGSGVSGTAHGLQIAIESALGRISLRTPPRSTGFRLENDEDTHALVASQDFIMAFRRDDNVWTLFADVDATGGMTQDASPQTNAIGASAEITECGDVTIGCDRDGANGFDGRVYWVLGFDAAISDTDLALADWADEANLKAAWLAGGDDFSITVDSASLALESFDVALLFDEAYVIPVEHGQLALEGQEIPFTLSQPGTHGQLALEGQEIQLLTEARIDVDHGELTLAGQDVGLHLTAGILVTAGQLALAGQVIGLSATGLPALGSAIAQRRRRR